MRLLKSEHFNKFLQKLIFCVMGALVLAGIAEVVCNFETISNHKFNIDISDKLERREDSWYIEYKFDKPVYVDKLSLTGEFKKDTSYTIDLSTRNEFGKKEKVTIKDQIYEEFTEAHTNINQRIKKLTITVKDAPDVEITHLNVSNSFTVNRYRLMVFAFIIFLVLCCIGFRKSLLERLEYFFAVYAFGFGALLIVMTGPYDATWDEQIHFSNVYQLASDSTVEWNTSAWQVVQKELPRVNTAEEMHMLKEYVNQNGDKILSVQDKTISYKRIANLSYLPIILSFKTASLTGMSFTGIYMFGKLGNLILFIILMSIAIHIAEKRKVFVFGLAALPTVLFQGSMYTYDGITFAAMTLGFILLMKEMNSNRRLNTRNLICSVILIIVGCLAKAIYIPMLFVMLAMQNCKFSQKKYACLFRGIICVLVLLMLSTFVLPVLSNAAQGNLSYGGDARGGDTSAVRQLISMVKHPLSSIRLFVSEILSFDNFRNLGIETKDHYLATNLMFLNFASLGTLKDTWSLGLIPFLLLLFFVPMENEKTSVNVRIWILLMTLASVVLIWLSMYLSFTPVGSGAIDGVQARYYLPLLCAFSYITWSDRIKINIRKEMYCTLVVGANILFMTMCVYQLGFMSRCG